ncbi:hypothetical protein B0O99DRAFT_648747 [Bisporella sp. PMI_857]|nr:hypothetical protein B0O99DRAFT_648747 [Bisporella sp. PMI_857]
MDHAWLDSLSEDWISQPRSAGSPVPSLPSFSRSTSSTTSNLRTSISRIPKFDSQKQSWVTPHDSSNPLGERSPSENNIPSSQRAARGQSKVQEELSDLTRGRPARRASTSTIASSLCHTVQHKSLSLSPKKGTPGTPEWKRRLLHGDIAYGEQRDLFAPAGLENIFRPPSSQPSSPQKFTDNVAEEESIMLSSPPAHDHVRIAQDIHKVGDENGSSQPKTMKYTLVDDDFSDFSTNDLSYGSNFRLSMKGQPRNDRARTLSQQTLPLSFTRNRDGMKRADRVISGQSDLRNEGLSPIYVSRHNTVGGMVDDTALDLSATELHDRLENIRENATPEFENNDTNNNNSSQVLPADVTNETEDYAHNGRFVNLRRGGHSQEGSFHQRMLSSTSLPVIDESAMLPEESMQASTPKQLPNIRKTRTSTDLPEADATATPSNIPQTPNPSPVRNGEKEQKSSAGSPLKLFGTHDTFTNQTLLRRLSQFEENFDGDDGESVSVSGQDSINWESNEAFVAQSSPQKVSQLAQINKAQISFPVAAFGKGDLDNYEFSEEYSYESSNENSQDENKENISLSVPEPRRPSSSKLQVNPSLNVEKVIEHRRTKIAKTIAKSPLKYPTPKRRRTLQSVESEESVISKDGSQQDSLRETHLQIQSVLGKKRKDAKHDNDQQLANPKVLALRQILRPRTPTPSQRSSVQRERAPLQELDLASTDRARLLQEQKIAMVQAELDATEPLKIPTALGISQVMLDESRKGSITTQDFLDEAKMIMAGIRGKARPNGGLRSVEESESENDRNASMGTDVPQSDDVEDSYQESTREPFSRPPSREGPPIPRQPVKQQDPALLDHLRKYEEMSDMDDIIASSMKSIALAKDAAKEAEEAGRTVEATISRASGRFLDENVESDPPNIRITESSEMQRKRKHSSSSIPNNDDDPFGDIPDLSVDETQERLRLKAVAAKQMEKERYMEAHTSEIFARPKPYTEEAERRASKNPAQDFPSLEATRINHKSDNTNTGTIAMEEDGLESPIGIQQTTNIRQTIHLSKSTKTQIAEEVEREISINEDRVNSASPKRRRNMSPPMSPYRDDGESANPAKFGNDSVLACKERSKGSHTPSSTRASLRGASRRISIGGHTFSTRPISRIDERDEETISVLVSTPGQSRKISTMVIKLTPMSDFTMNQKDSPFGMDVSYVAGGQRYLAGTNSRSTLSLSIKQLVEKITERMNLESKKLSSLHKLDEFCEKLEELNVSKNQISQLNGAPRSVRHLSITHNYLSDLTAWGHLSNLHLSAFSTLTLTGITNLDGLLSLRLRGNLIDSIDFQGTRLHRLSTLDLNDNQIVNIQNLHQLCALTTLSLEDNKLTMFSIDQTQKLESLKYLKLGENFLQSIDVSQLPNLRVLYLDRNRLGKISGLLRTKYLDSLSVREQRDAVLNTSFLSEAFEVRKLFLSGNLLENFNPRANFLNLQYLELANCGLESLPIEFGQMFPNARVLNLNYNALKGIESLFGIVRLKKLYLAGNRLSTVRKTVDVIEEFPTLRSLDLRNNPINIGFYPPHLETQLVKHDASTFDDIAHIGPFALVRSDEQRDKEYSSRLDKGTKMLRRVYEMMMLSACARLKTFDGLEVDRIVLKTRDEVWECLVRAAPASISSLWFASNSVAAASSSSKITSSIATNSNTALASGIFAQALQCPNPVTPSTTKILSGGVTTIISLVACSTGVSAGNALNGNAQGVCHASGDTTFSVSRSYSVCCPNGWATTPLVKNLFCYTAIAGGDVEKRAVTKTLPGESVRIDGIAFARAGVVTDGSTATGSSSNMQVISMPVTTTSVGGTGASGTSTVNSSMTTGGTHKLNTNVQVMLGMIGLLYIMI